MAQDHAYLNRAGFMRKDGRKGGTHRCDLCGRQWLDHIQPGSKCRRINANPLEADLPQLKQRAKEFKDVLPTCNEEEAAAAFKCFVLGYFNFKPGAAHPWDQVDATCIFNIISKLYLDWQLERVATNTPADARTRQPA